MPRSMHRLADDRRRDRPDSGRRGAAVMVAATVAFMVTASVAAQTPSSAGQVPDLASTTFAWLALGADWRDPPAGSGRGPVRQDPDHPFVGNVGNNGRQVTVRLGNYRDPVLKPWAAAQMRRVQRGGHQRQAGGRVRGAGALLSGRRAGATALSRRADVFHPDAQRGVDDLAARPHGAPHLFDRQAFGTRGAVVVRRIDRAL